MPFWRRNSEEQQPQQQQLAYAAAHAQPVRGSGNVRPAYGGGGGGGAAVAPSAPPAPRQIFDAGNVALSYYGAFPDYIKLIKQIYVKPLIFTATAAVNPRTRKRFINFSLRETVFDGAFICHVSRKSLEYRNNLPLPIGGVGTVVLAAEWRLGQPIHKPRLMVALGGDAGAAVMRPGSISWRKAFFPWRAYNRHIGMEAATDVSVAMQHDFNDQSSSSGFKVNFDVKELNLVVKV